ncbi:MAG TPA: arginine--tRNA ligase [Caldithrix abyssi]|uniref:Arginine--tRNA ligase n=1 Tax=Caldithrix abyssi TaxID=187145 RepID=A0A7V1LQ12_CALAY|nr:arginine--tRNA ligase [Caldithrix abyssi]
MNNSEAYIKQQLSAFLDKHQISGVPVILQRPREEQFGDHTSNIAMQLARFLKKKPRDIATDIVNFFPDDNPYVDKIEIAGPGFINFYVKREGLYEQLREILQKKEKYGRGTLPRPQRAQIEFVSANPTGPLTIGHGRQAVLGDAVASIMEAAGYEVTREYYFNNAGRQMRVLGESVRLRYLEICGQDIVFPEDHYQGEYIRDIARSLYDTHGDALKDIRDVTPFKDAAESAIFEDIKKTIARLGFSFDSFFNEKSLYDNGKIDEIVTRLKEKGLVDTHDGATWFLTSKLGFDQDRVIIKSTGEPTYRLPDMAYHVNKMERGYDRIIDIFGADHIDTYPDVLAALKALGYDVDKVTVLIHQFVTLTERGEKVKMSTRKANFVTLDDLMDEVGVDVTRYFFLMRSMNSHLNFDLALAKTQSDENPVFYIQYAHARINSIHTLAAERKLDISHPEKQKLDILQVDEEIVLIKELIQFPKIISQCAETLEPHKLVNYLHNLATVFHRFYTVCRVITDDKELSLARLALIEATKIVIANGLGILHIQAPERM